MRQKRIGLAQHIRQKFAARLHASTPRDRFPDDIENEILSIRHRQQIETLVAGQAASCRQSLERP
ncbi:hypothetical protein [Silicimonas sp. MF1-12-2]|uniref:hypothetical protein n=1 Tax=Silicimonas sp. MF1-12-2 TaxID=3384793 RepID=UPI0039B6E47C